MLGLRRDVVAGEEDWARVEGAINAGYNRVGIEGGEWGRVGWQGGGVRGWVGERETYLWRGRRGGRDLKDGL